MTDPDMSDDLVARAHQLYEDERDHLRSLLERDPTYAGLMGRLEGLEARLGGAAGAQMAAALSEARRLILEMTREQAFKMGYLYAHTTPSGRTPGS